MNIKFSQKQKDVWADTVKNFHRWNFSVGAVRSGKTYLDYWRIPWRVKHAKDGLILLAGNTLGTLERNILAPLRGIWGSHMVGNVRADGRVRLFGADCYALGADKADRVSKLQGAGLGYCYGDEVTTWCPDVFDMLKSRLDKKGACFDGTCNPDAPNHWLKKFLDSGAGVRAHHFTIDDNPFLADTFVDALKREYAGTVLYDRFILGKWAAAEGMIYTPFSRKCVLNTDGLRKFLAENPLVYLSMGADIGGNKSATVFTLAGFTAGFKHVVILDETYDRQNTSAECVIELFMQTVSRWKDEYPRLTDCYVDSAEQLFVKSFRAKNSGVNVLNARKTRVNDRIFSVMRLMAQKRFWVSERCGKLIDAIETAVWDDKIMGEKRKDDGSSNVDSLDSMEYAIEGRTGEMLNFGGA